MVGPGEWICKTSERSSRMLLNFFFLNIKKTSL